MINKIKFLTLILITSLTFSCVTEDSGLEISQEYNTIGLEEKLYELETNENLKLDNSDKIRFDKDRVKTSFNCFDNLGIDFVSFLETIKLKRIHEDKDIENYINANLDKFSSFEFEFNEVQKNIIKSFLENKVNDNTIIYKIKAYENFVKNNFERSSENYNNLLAFFSLNKWVSYKYIYLDKSKKNIDTAKRDWACGHRDCFDCCMSTSIGNYNIVDWAEIVASGGAGLAWQAGSCMWDCA
jgi:hypothetical protein